MREFGLIGKTLGHSFSRRYFTEKFAREGIEASYTLFELATIEAFPELIAQHPHLRGLNVTVPYKTAVMPYLDACSEEAVAVGAVNTLLFEKGKLTGFNTDTIGFHQSLKRVWGEGPVRRALVLGTGGSAKAVRYVLRKHFQAALLHVSRWPQGQEIGYADLARLSPEDFDLVVNTTPLGMYPNTAEAPDFPFEKLDGRHLVFDLVYNPEETLFLRRARERGARTCNGLEMLYLQAEAAWEIWNR